MRRPTPNPTALRPRFAMILAAIILAPAIAGAFPSIPIDLRSQGSVGAANGALLYQDLAPPVAGGFYDPFLRLQGTPTEEGFNTDYRHGGRAPLDAKADPSYTHSLRLGSLQETSVGGTAYYVFSLAIDEPESGLRRQVSLDRVMIYLASAPDLTDLSGASLRWDLDGAGDRAVFLDAAASTSGKGGVRLLVPTSYFKGAGEDQCVYLYSVLGAAGGYEGSSSLSHASHGGYEEWAALLREPSALGVIDVSEPPGILLIGLVFASLVVAGRWFHRAWRRGKEAL